MIDSADRILLNEIVSFDIDLPPETHAVLQSIAHAGILGCTPQEVAAYLVTRGLDDMLRSGCVSLGQEPAA